MQRHLARIEVSPEFVMKALHFPSDTEVVGAGLEFAANGMPILALLLEHPDLAPVDEAMIVPTVMPTIDYHRESWDFNWNQPQPQDEAELPHPEELADEEALRSDG